MNSRKVRYSCFLVCLTVLLGFSWTAPAAAGDAADVRLAAGPISGGGVGSTKPAPSLPVKPLPAGTPLAAPKTSQPPIAAAQPVEPAWPQPFELGPGEQTGFAFVVGNPGPIVVNIRWTGVPLTATLVKPGGVFIYQQGNGSMTLQYNATADDVKKGVLWGLSLRPTQVTATPPAGTGIAVIEKPVKIDTRGLAKGTVNVQHPPGDMKLAQAELKARADRLALQAKSQPVPTANVNVLAQKQAALQKQQTVRQAALLEQIRSKIPVQAYQQTSQRIALGAQPGASKGIIVPDFDKIAAPPEASATTAASGVPLKQKTGVAVKATVPDPVIRLIEHSLSTGQPGDPVLLAGSGFSNNPGEVHFIVADGKDVAAPVTFWSDTQIIVPVPDVYGILAFNGQVYVKRGASMSNPLSFRFEPSVEYRKLVMGKNQDSYGQWYGGKVSDLFLEPGTNPARAETDPAWRGDGFVLHDFRYDFLERMKNSLLYALMLAGGKGDDLFHPFYTSHLKNGWIADSAYLSSNSGSIQIVGSADAYISEFTPGTSTPNLKVHWWADLRSAVQYSPYIVIKGPKAVAYQ